ncbi:ATP-binding cassette domain-containing protein [Streptococcus suis]|nr:ATP-binding cassette domain-containing protein [Streptococcus suis]
MIRLDKVCKGFGNRQLFTDVSLQLEAGKIYALIGASGSGKTTLMNMLGKLEDYEGSISYRGRELRSYKSTDFFRHELGYLFQHFGLIESQTVGENLKLGLVGQKLTKVQQVEQQQAALEAVGLTYLDLSAPIYELSGGEAQRVALAKIILKNPSFILADEPTASVDPETAGAIMDLLLSLRKENRLILIATHNPSIWEMADEVLRIEEL